MNREVEAYEGELRELRKKNETLMRVFKQAFSSSIFICGGTEAKDEMGLPDKIFVCPYEGLDGFAVYTKTSDYSAPEW